MTEQTNIDTAATAAPETILVEGEEYAKIIMDDEGNYHVVDFDGTVGPACKFCDADDKTIVLTRNKSNRQWFNRKKAEAEIAANGYVSLRYKAHRTLATAGGSNKLPNEKLIAYLTPAEQEEYRGIIQRAIQARDAAKEAAKAAPKTELDKAKERLAKAQEALAKLEAQAAEATEA